MTLKDAEKLGKDRKEIAEKGKEWKRKGDWKGKMKQNNTWKRNAKRSEKEIGKYSCKCLFLNAVKT